MSYQNIRNIREGFVNMRAGDKLIKIESRICAIGVFILLLAYFKKEFAFSLVIGVVVGWGFPWLVGLIEFFAWVATIVFSIVWAVLVYYVLGAACGTAVGVVGAVIIFIISFFLHKIFAGLGYSSVEKHALDAMNSISENTAQTRNMVNNISNNTESNIKYCTGCGSAMDGNARFCASCGRQQ